MIPIDETVREFLVESHENLDGLERDLVAIEADPRDAKTLGRIFRTIHTIKGTCGFLALPRLESVAHAGEGLLCELRDGRLAWHAEVTGAMLALVDTLRTTLRSIESTGEEGVGDDEPLVSWLNRLQRGEAGAEVETPTTSDAPTTIDPAPHDDAEPIAEVVVEACTTSAESAMARPVAPVGDGGDGTPGDAAHGNVRVDVGLLDKLMNLVGELVLTRNQILQHAGTRDDSALLGTSQRLNLITTELQEGVMKTRMQPIGTVWNKFPRVVRDLAVACGKRVRIEMEGRETELDRTIIEAIKDPLTHLVRNSIDHGIESSDRRVAAGKPAEGRLRLRAYHESGQVNIEISDDGGGIDPARVARVAVERGVVTREQAARMDDREVLQLVFVPGFSTAERVTNISGRGVGMDVVKTNIEKIGGTVDLQSQPGVGTTIKIKIPLTLAIIPALIVTAGGDRYAIPQVNLLELVRLEGEQARREVETIKGTPIYRLRGHLLPLVDLGRALGVATSGRVVGAGSAEHQKTYFGELRSMHLRWMDRLRRMLDGHERIDIGQLSEPTECELGRWLAGPGAYLSGRSEYTRLAELHSRFHTGVRGVVELEREGRAGESRLALARLDELSTELIRAVRAVEESDSASDVINIVVLQADGRQFGLAVDDICDTEEIVVKPLGKCLKGVALFAGATIMGDGRVALILDVPGIAQRAGLASGASARDEAGRGEEAASADGRKAFLLFRVGTRRLAVPMDLVARLEEIPRGHVEQASGREVVQYRDQIMPLVRLADVLGTRSSWGADGASEAGDATMPTIVYRDRGRGIGLVVDQILDVVEEVPRLHRADARPGLLGSVVLQKHVTDLLDVAGLIRMAGLESSDRDSVAWTAAIAEEICA